MSGRRFKAEEIGNKLWQADTELARGSSVAAVCKLLGVTDATYFGDVQGVGRDEGRSGAVARALQLGAPAERDWIPPSGLRIGRLLRNI
jgi:hypothetical protein